MAITSKSPFRLVAFGCFLLASSTAAFAQRVEVDKPKIGITIQKTPRLAVVGPKEKRDTQKFWIEVEVELKADQKGGDPNNDFIDELEVKYFITVTPKNAKDRKVYTMTVLHGPILKNQTTYSVAYISPNNVAKIVGKDKAPGKADVDVAVEIRYQGQLVAGDSTKSPSSKWWNKMSQAEGMVLKKSETPFAPLWFDRYAEEKKN